MTGKPIIYEELTAVQVKEMIDGGMDMAIMPIGATEQHGPHLPLNVDTLIPDRMAREVSAESGIPVFPSFAYGQSSSHAGFRRRSRSGRRHFKRSWKRSVNGRMRRGSDVWCS